MGKAGLLSIVGLGLGFVAGLAWGRSTRTEVGGHVTTAVNNGVVTVSLDARQAASDGLKNIFEDWR